jgi:RNA polymerase-binding transcription factor DksA
MAKVIKKTKPAAKKTPAKKAAAKPVKKAIAKKPVVKAKPAPKKAVKPVAKKVAAKLKATPKPVKKAVAKKPVVKAKPAVVKPAIKKAAPKPVVKPTPKPIVKKAAPKPVVKPENKAVAEKVTPTPVQRHFHETKPAMETSVVRYNDADLALFKSVILKKIAKAKEEIDFYSDQIKNTSESQTEFASIDDGSSTSERENMNQIVVRMQKLISHLESALVRIENKSYGICRETGKLIPKERLLVVPHATLSVEGKKMEKK